MTITAKNIGRINVWPTYAVAREADTEESKFTGQLTVWRTNSEALANVSHEEGGGGAPDWVPANAVIHIDLVGGTPQGRAWVAGAGEVAVDTLLGSDANAVNFFGGPAAYNPDGLTEDGYSGFEEEVRDEPVALTGAALAQILAGCTGRVKTKEPEDPADIGINPMYLYSADASSKIAFSYLSDSTVHGSSYGTYDRASDAILNVSVGNSINIFAFTLTSTRAEFACNGSSVYQDILVEGDWPTSGDSMLAAAVVYTAPTSFIQSITLYDPLPSTAGLSDLSEV